MRTYTYSEARRNLSSVLDRAKAEGQALIRRKDGSLFVVKPTARKPSPFDVDGVETGLSADEIVATIREGRER